MPCMRSSIACPLGRWFTFLAHKTNKRENTFVPTAVQLHNLLVLVGPWLSRSVCVCVLGEKGWEGDIVVFLILLFV